MVCLSTYSSFTNDLLTVYSENSEDMTEHLQQRPALGGHTSLAASRPWSLTLMLGGAGLAVLIVLFFDTAAKAVSVWSNSSAYNYSFLIIPVSAWLIWERRRELARMSPEPAPLFLLLMIPAAAAWLASDIADIYEGRQFALMGMIQIFLLSLLGWRVYRFLLFPLSYLWLLVPTGEFLLPWLQQLAADMSTRMIELSGLPVYQEGVIIQVPSGLYRVAPECAGLNFFLSSFALSLVYAQQVYQRWHKRLLCIAVALIIAIIANWIRIYAIIMLGDVLENPQEFLLDHGPYGWAFFAAVMMVSMGLGWLFRDPLPAPAPVKATPRRATPWRLAAVTAAALLIAATPRLYAEVLNSRTLPAGIALDLPERLGPWQRSGGKSDWRPRIPAADIRAQNRYLRDGEAVDIAIAAFIRQRPGYEVASNRNRAADNLIWVRNNGGRRMAEIAGRRIRIAFERLRSGNRQRLVWTVFWLGGELTANPLKAKLLRIRGQLPGGDARAAIIMISTEFFDEERANARLNNAAAALAPLIDALNRLGPGPAS